MKTPQQKKFEKLVTSMILCEPVITSRTGVLEDFQQDSERYYDIFCDKIFEIAWMNHKDCLLIDERGLSYIGESLNNQHHVYFRILSEEDLKKDADDIIVYIELALKHLEEQLKKVQKSFL